MPRIHRRRFLQQSAGLAAGVTILQAGSARTYAANEKINVASIGVRGMGGSLLNNFAAQKDVNLVAICDIDDDVRGKRGTEIEKKTGTMPKLVKNFREVMDDKSIDAVTIGTPDHWHALLTVHACIAGKDVYTEKPDGHNIREGQAMIAASRKHDRMVQMGTQARSGPYMKEAHDLVASGAIGKVVFGRAWETDRQGAIPRVPDGEPPATVDYDMWLGPAPKRPFNPYRFHGNWRWFFDYGCGDLGNDGVHRLDNARNIMGVTELPTAVSASGGKLFFDDAQEWPDTQIVTYDFPGKVLVYEMRIWSKPRLLGLTEAAAVYGDSGWVLISNTGYQAFDGDGKLIKEGKGSNGENLTLHIRNFLDAVRSRKRETLNQEIAGGHLSSVLCHAGNIAWRTGKKLKLDPKTESFDDAEANKFLGREYRKGYELPKV